MPGMKQFRPRRFNPYMGYRFRRPYVPPYFYSPYGYGYVFLPALAILSFNSSIDEKNEILFLCISFYLKLLQESSQVQKANALHALLLKEIRWRFRQYHQILD